jgi:hypothetical protein
MPPEPTLKYAIPLPWYSIKPTSEIRLDVAPPIVPENPSSTIIFEKAVVPASRFVKQELL